MLLSYLYDILLKATLGTENAPVVVKGGGEERGLTEKGTRNLFGVLDLFYTTI